MKNPCAAVLIIILGTVFIAMPVSTGWTQILNAVPTDNLAGHHLYNLKGHNLGRIEKVTYDDFGQPLLMVLLVAGTNRIVPIPFSALLPVSNRSRLVVNISEDQLRRAPNYSINALTNF